MQDLRAAGFSPQQAEVLAEKLESAAQATQQDLKDFIRQELTTRFAEADNKATQFRQDVKAEFTQFRQDVKAEFAQVRGDMNSRFAEQEARFERSLRVLLATILTAFVGVTTLAVAIIKLFPNAH